MAKMHIKKNDKVKVLAGKDRGKTSRVLRVLADKGGAIVENVNQVYKHVRPNPQKNVKGGIVQKERPIDVSNLMVICPSCSQATRVNRSPLPDGRKVRVCKKCSANID